MDSIDAILGTGALDHGTAGKVTRSTCKSSFALFRSDRTRSCSMMHSSARFSTREV